jgi:hypothetical protein
MFRQASVLLEKQAVSIKRQIAGGEEAVDK